VPQVDTLHFFPEVPVIVYHLVATSPVVLHWLCDSPRTGCTRRTKIYVCGANKQ